MLPTPEQSTPLTLDLQLNRAYQDLGISSQNVAAINGFLSPLRINGREWYDHSIRVGLLARDVGRFLGLDEKAMFYSGILHDIGKATIPQEILEKKQGLTESEFQVIEQHVMNGYNALKGKFDFTAEVILLHHRFQKHAYPERIPQYLHPYSAKTQALISEYARLLAMTDTYDALHRENDKFGPKRVLSGPEIKAKMLELNPDRVQLIGQLYEAGIFLQ